MIDVVCAESRNPKISWLFVTYSSSMIWHQIQAARTEGRDLHVVFLDLTNAFGMVPRSLLWKAFSYFQVPEKISALLKAYFEDNQLCFNTSNHYILAAFGYWHHGWKTAFPPLAHTMAMEVIINTSNWVVRGVSLQDGTQLPPIRAFMDDMADDGHNNCSGVSQVN